MQSTLVAVSVEAPKKTESIDHIPPRSFFLGRVFPPSLIFPACKACNNASSDAEDKARTVSLIQGTALNPSVLDDFVRRERSYMRAVQERKIRLSDKGEMFGEHHLLEIDEATQESIIDLSVKITLALHYLVTSGDIVRSSQPVSMTFYTANKPFPQDVDILRLFPFLPKDPWFEHEENMAQFYYRYANTQELYANSEPLPMPHLFLFHLHQGFRCMSAVHNDKASLKSHDTIVRYASGA